MLRDGETRKGRADREGMLGWIVGAISLFLFLVLFIQVYLMSTIVQWRPLPLTFWLFHAFVALLSFYLSFRFMKSGGVIPKINVLLSSISTVLVVVFVFNFTDNCLGERKESVTDVRLLMKYREEHNYRGSHHTIYKYKVQPMHGASRKVTVDSNTYYKYDVGDTIKLNTFEGFWNTIRVKSVE